MDSFWFVYCSILFHLTKTEHATVNIPFTRLLEATITGNISEVKKILQNDPHSLHDIDGEGMSPCHWAALRGKVDTLKALLESGADLHLVDNDNNTALHLAAASGKPEAVRILLTHGSPVDAQNKVGDTPLHFAVKDGTFDSVVQLLDHGASVNITNHKGQFPLDLAKSGNCLAIRKLLNSVGAQETVEVVKHHEDDEAVTGVSGLYGWEYSEDHHDAELPVNAVMGGYDLDCGLYVGRVKHQKYLLPAKICPHSGFAYYSFNDNEYYGNEYWILCSDHVIWKRVKREIPPEAFAAGETPDGEKLYIGRAFFQFDGKFYLTPGKVVPSEKKLYATFHYKVHETDDFEILILQP